MVLWMTFAGCSPSILAHHAIAADKMARMVNQATLTAGSVYREQQFAAGRKAFETCEAHEAPPSVSGDMAPPERRACDDLARLEINNVRLRWSRVWHLHQVVRGAHELWKKAIEAARERSEEGSGVIGQWMALAVDTLLSYEEFGKALSDFGIKVLPIPKELTEIARGEL